MGTAALSKSESAARTQSKPGACRAPPARKSWGEGSSNRAPRSSAVALAASAAVALAAWVHTRAPAAALAASLDAQDAAFADRSTWIADADYERVPTTALISKAYAAERAAAIFDAPPTITISST